MSAQSVSGTVALVLATATFLGVTACKHLSGVPNEQGWRPSEQLDWQRGSQGSRLIPYHWLVELEDANSTAKLISGPSMARFGYIFPDTGDEPRLPIGFAVDRTDDEALSVTRLRWFDKQGSEEPWVGMNCSACHTAEMTYQGQRLRIDGGPTLADFQGFIRALNASMAATYRDPAKWNRFASAVLASRKRSAVRDTPANRTKLRSEFGRLLAWQEKVAGFNKVEIDYGPGRLDAVGHILNKVATVVEADSQFAGPPDAPVSYPFIWNANQHDFVQWNGIAPNKAARFPSGETFDAGALVRNTSEVIGVFADVKLRKASIDGYRSSVNVRNLDAMEVQLGRLMSPPWPSFMPLDRSAVAYGARLFADKCASCHKPLDRTDLKTPIKAEMTPIFNVGTRKGVGTDPWMACNAFTYQAGTGWLKGVKNGFVTGDRFGDQDFTKNMLTATTVGVLLGKKRQIAESVAKAAFGIPRQIDVAEVAAAPPGQPDKAKRLRECRENAGHRLVAYKARPLNGIWATAPYLHNGSVKSLYELLLPPTRRDASFFVGNREFDARRVGYVDAPAPYGRAFNTHGNDGKAIDGNSNLGHDYGNSELCNNKDALLCDNARQALVEYMKTL